MPKTNWNEIRKEYEVSSNGVLKPSRIIYELDKSKEEKRKQNTDILFRIISAFAIAIPIILFIIQNRSNMEKEKREYTRNLVINSSTSFHTIFNDTIGSKSYQYSKTQLFYSNYLRIALLDDSSFLQYADELKDVIEVREEIYNAQNIYMTSLSNLITQEKKIRLAYRDTTTVAASYSDFSMSVSNTQDTLSNLLENYRYYRFSNCQYKIRLKQINNILFNLIDTQNSYAELLKDLYNPKNTQSRRYEVLQNLQATDDNLTKQAQNLIDNIPKWNSFIDSVSTISMAKFDNLVKKKELSY